MDIMELLACFTPYLNTTTLRQMTIIVTAVLTMTGRITMLGISRWAAEGGSYRMVQRWFNTVLLWPLLYWIFFCTQLYQVGDPYILVGDETVVPKAGQHTHGLDRFFLSLYGKPIPGLAFPRIDQRQREERQAYPVQVEQMLKDKCGKHTPQKTKASQQPPADPPKRPVGRPKGSKNKDKTQVKLTPELKLIQNMLLKQLVLINGLFKVKHMVLDGHFGNNNALQMVRQCDLHVVSKLRCDAALYFRYDGPQHKCGQRRKYGDEINYRHLPAYYLQASETHKIRTDYYQATMLYPCTAKSEDTNPRVLAEAVVPPELARLQCPEGH
jgi:hypothetical protein